MNQQEWWRGATIYQIYPRSFMDSSGDGIGDLPGIIEKLDYVAGLGVDAIWISPFFKSPMADFGYDVSDYRAVDPMFGTLEDFDRLIKRSHELGLKVIIDQVLSHTSDQHPWFQQSRQSRDNDKADWYVWADPKPDGSPPNNWLSIFGGVAWQWESRRRQYYLHNFLASQPDLNFHNPLVRQQILDEAEFWLKRGVDGFRLDTANFYFHDAELRDNAARPLDVHPAGGVSPDNPYAYQYHEFDKSRPENLGFLQELRALMDRYPGSTTVGEISGDDSPKLMAQYTSDNDKLHMAYSFDLLSSRFSPVYIRTIIEKLENTIGDGWPCWSMSNHDVVRVASRWGGAEAPAELARVLLALLFSLRGSVCLYQGEELGLPEAEVPFEHLQDPYGITFWPEFKGRDGCRTPMPWTQDGVSAGFSETQAWLPIAEQHRLLAVDVQERVPGSVLNACRAFLAWRRQQKALQSGDIEFVEASEQTLTFIRSHAGERLLASFNLSAETAHVTLPAAGSIEPCSGHGFAAHLQQNQIELPSYQAFFGIIKN